MSKTYEDGLNEAWELARRLENELTPDKRVELFGYWSPYEVVNALTPQEVIEKLEKHDRIKVGDEVKACSDMLGVVLERYDPPCDNEMTMLWANGVVCGFKEQELTKTGRHFPQIEEVLKQMKGEA